MRRRIVRAKTEISPATKAFLEVKKTHKRFLPEIQHALIEKQVRGDDRVTDHIHPSDLAKGTWCQRACFYHVTGHTLAERKPYWRMGSVYHEGHMIHDKWQGWFWDLGILEGVFLCLHCNFAMVSVSPTECSNCGSQREALRYLEVPVLAEPYLLAGHGDGMARDTWLEFKSLGVNTLRFEDPDLLAAHTYNININGKRREFIDLDELWGSIQRPLPSHRRQGAIYCFLWNRMHPERPIDEIVFIYECKWNQDAKEFVVRYSEDTIRDRLDACLTIADRVRNQGSAPDCSWDAEDGCPECRPYDKALAKPRSRRTISRTPRPDGAQRPVRRIARRQPGGAGPT